MALTQIRKCKRCKQIIYMPSKSVISTYELSYVHLCEDEFQYSDTNYRIGKTKLIGYKMKKTEKKKFLKEE